MCFASGFAQVKYSKGSDKVIMNVVTEDSLCYLLVNFSSEKKKMMDTPKLLIRLFNDEVISLEGDLLYISEKAEAGVMVGYMMIPISKKISDAKFLISRSQIDKLSVGVKKIRLNTSPKFHEKEWSKDKIGKKLYESFSNAIPNSFNDNF